jgi:hypothetical protein
MRYLSTEEIKLPKPMGDTKTLPEILKAMGEVYAPSAKFSLVMKQLRSLNKALDVLEGAPEDGYYVLDNEEVEVLKVLVEQYAPIVLVNARNAPAILDALVNSPEKRPEKAGASDNGVVKEAEKVAQGA